MRALLSEALDCIRQAINGCDHRSGIGDPTGPRPPMTADLRPPNVVQTGDTLASISRKFYNRRRAGKNHSLEAERPACAFGGSAAPSDDAKTNAALPPKLASSKGLLDPPCKPETCATFTDRPEDQGQVRWRVAADYLRRRRQKSQSCFHCRRSQNS